ncbi:MAG: hypothetical protein MSG64_05320 [Pyrinomonadaceae bacterium MAG19_C2-C3]|nr:hypothetical protein [Pyrinomonadaceae bacterium MAG19_C2-C3]
MDSTTNAVRETLRRVIEKHGQGLYESPKRLESLLRDLCGAHRREINIIIGALEERVAADLITKHRGAVPRDVLLAQLTQRLRDHLAYTPDAALWGVETWAFALGVLSEQDLEARAQKRRIVESTPPVEHTIQSAPQPPPLPSTRQPKPASRQPSPPLPTSPARSSPPTRQPSPPPKIKPASPATTRTNAAQAATQVVISHPTQIAAQPKPARRGFGWRGCLVTLLVVIVLFIAGLFIVPSVIMRLREEQSRPSINEPRINR